MQAAEAAVEKVDRRADLHPLEAEQVQQVVQQQRVARLILAAEAAPRALGHLEQAAQVW
jgi:hypothetical protein